MLADTKILKCFLAESFFLADAGLIDFPPFSPRHGAGRGRFDPAMLTQQTPDVDPMLVQCCADIEPTLGQHLVFAGKLYLTLSLRDRL